MGSNICGARVKALREAKGWGQIDLAVALSEDWGIKMTQSDVSEIERGVRGVKDIELRAFAKEFGVSADSLLDELSSG